MTNPSFGATRWRWPAFNVADVAITCGAALLVFASFRVRPAVTADPAMTERQGIEIDCCRDDEHRGMSRKSFRRDRFD